MTVLLVLFVFALFAVADYVASRGKVPHLATSSALKPALVVDGCKISDNVRYHPGHAWTLQERKHRERIGIDEFAAALAGPVDKIELPKLGQWLRQGQKAWGFSRNGEKVEMVSPVEGEVIEINPEVVKNPSLLRTDPYGKGWLAVVNVPDEESTGRNLLPRNLVPNWMRTAMEGLYASQMQLVGATSADGGQLVEDPTAALSPAEWRKLAGEFFLTL